MFLQSSVSGLRQLFSTAPSPHTPRGQRQLESVTEEAHTYDLLYPEGEALRQGQHYAYPLRQGDPSTSAAVANSSDDRGGLDIQSPRDVRIIIAQDANALSSQPRVLYDSHPPPPIPQARNATFPEASKNGPRKGGSFTGGERSNENVKESHTAPHTRQSSFSQTAQSIFTSPTSPLSPVSELGSLFSNAGRRNHTQRPATSDGETAQSKIARKVREETDALLDCMFGATGFPSISSTKLHVGPPKALDVESDKNTNLAARDVSFSGAFPKRRTPLTRSTTAADLQSLSTTAESRDADPQPPRPTSSSILITRLFSIDPKESAHHTQGPDEPAKSVRGQPRHESDDVAAHRRTKAKQLKTPTYAVAVLLQMPIHRQRPPTPSMQYLSPQRSSPMGFAAINTHSWPRDGAQVTGIAFDSNRDIEYVIAHWTILIRALSSLEIVARCKISDALVRQELPYLEMLFTEKSKASEPGPGIKPSMLKPPTQRTLQLPAGALQQCSIVQNFTDLIGKRIGLALKTRRVVAGQPRWGIWREEGRLVGACVGGRDQNFFLFNLLTAFLGSHTEWLESLGPSRYRRRHAKHSNDVNGEVSAIQHRTVIVSQDKMTARRLIFLLSAFLPGIHRRLTADGQNQSNQSDASWSNAGYSQSPPSGVLMQRRQSLRRTMNRRNGENPPAVSATSHARSVSFSGSDVTPGDDAVAEGLSIQHRSRRTSDARSIRSALPISSNASATRKSSTTTTATVTPEAVIDPTVIPATHFSSYSTDPRIGTTAEPRPESSGTCASLSLKRTLSRSESNEHGNASSDSQSGSRWGSVISGFWSGRRASSTEDSDLLASSQEGLGISGVPNELHSQGSMSKLAQMVEEIDTNGKAQRPLESNTATPPSPASARRLYFTSGIVDKASPPKNIPEKRSLDRFPLKLSIDQDDGVVDVDLPPNFPYSSSFPSIMSSPPGAPTAASSFNDRQSLHGRTSAHDSSHRGAESAVDVAGWLRRYHQDFALQAVRPYDTLKEDVKRSMRTEPTPAIATPPMSEAGDAASEWTEICTTLIADTTNFTVTRLCLRRKNATSPHHQANALLESSTIGDASEEEIVEEPIMDMDPTLIDAVERVLAQSGQSSRAASRPPSPSRHTPNEDIPGLEIHRSECKKMVLGALEQVAKSVSAELSTRSRVEKNVGGSHRGRENLPADSTLREGVRKWLNEVGREGA
ncbi:hypothetical protein HO173_009116 [Letharia columbiana]|uniref:Folliculin-interacting protein N-terminal domain-containing protein n=1 Tax=Letharia columbiana TaxID=112416 RepID=A0A8H6FQ71_9LECA|nr:uncharacterized protein HO173_009116 [Letharia columbiana]KAF6232677.1 hypothetical protein HO173_009116 [Letharia columbiana]